MSFEQHPEQDGQRRDPQDAETTGRIYGADDHTAHLPAHPRPEHEGGTQQQGLTGAQQQYGGGQQSYGGPQQPSYGTGSRQQSYGAPQQSYGTGSQQQSYGTGASNPYAPPAQHHTGTAGNGYGAPSYASNAPYRPGDNGNGAGGKRRTRWAAVPLAAGLAAVLASGGTYAL